MENKNKACKIVTIKEIIPLFKGTEKANTIELVSFEEIGNKVVTGKRMYNPYDKALFIEPDYCLPDTELFHEYIAPNYDPKKSKLGKNNRIKAIKFNLHIGDNQPVYSYGILIPIQEISKKGIIINNTIYEDDVDLDEALGITKYEEPEPFQGHKGQVISCPFPEQMYKTDETNINNIINDIEFPIYLIGSQKIDGSSISIWYKNGKFGIASRNQGKPLTYKKVVGYKKPNLFFKLLKFLNILNYDGRIIELTQSDDQFVVMGKPYLEKIILFEKNIVLRGEMCGKSCKGSGNPNNPSAKEDNHIEFFGIDDYTHSATRLPYSSVRRIAENLNLPLVHTYFEQTFNSKEELLSKCQEIFNAEKEKGKIIEGIVVRNETGLFSAKILNLLYDSLK